MLVAMHFSILYQLTLLRSDLHCPAGPLVSHLDGLGAVTGSLLESALIGVGQAVRAAHWPENPLAELAI